MEQLERVDLLSRGYSEGVKREKREKVKRRINECKTRQRTYLDLSNCSLTQLPEEISVLPHLVTLILNRNNLENFKGLEKLTQIRKLHLNGCGLTFIPKEIFDFSALKVLDLSNNDLKGIPLEFSSLKNLTFIELCNCNLSSFPVALLGLKNLAYLNLRNHSHNEFSPKNLITTIPPEIIQLSKLKSLSLQNNLIRELPIEFTQLNLTELGLRGNPIEIPPAEIAIERGAVIASGNFERIKNYFNELKKQQADYLHEVKLLLVGEERAGKTSLAEVLSNPKYTFKDKQSTEGIDISKWIIPKEESKFDKDFRVNIWDFGGQEIYHSTHQFFLTKRSIYFLVTEARKDLRHDDFYYWMSIIDKLGGKSPVIILLNKCDQPNTGLAIQEYKETFGHIVDYLKVSCKDDYRETIQSLKAVTVRVLQNKKLLPDIGTPLPKVWVDIRGDLEALTEDGFNYISYARYLILCTKHGMNEERALYLSDFFHRLGVFLHFRNNLFLEETIFLNHEWVTEGVYNVLDNQDVINRHGKFNETDLKHIWNAPKYKDKRPELLHLMENFELCFKVGNGIYLAPQLLPTDKPGDLHGFENPTNFNDPLYFEYRYTFMPKGILSRFIVKRNKYIYKNTYWKFGVVLEYADTRALVRERYFESPKRITITLEGENKKVLLAMIRETLAEIHGNFHNLEFHEMLPCSCNQCKASPSPHYYRLAALEARLHKDKQTIECQESFENMEIRPLVDEVIIRDWDSLKPRKREEVFISYSHKDNDWLERIQTHLKALRNEGIDMDVWDDTHIKPGDTWKKEITQALNSAKIALLLITTDFLASDFITRVELPTLLKAAQDEGTLIIPILVKPSRFTRHKDLSQFQAVNSPDKALSSLPESEQDEILVKLATTIREYLTNE